MKSKAHTVFCVLAICASFIVNQNLKAQDYLELDNRFSQEEPYKYNSNHSEHLLPDEWSIGYLAEHSFFGEYGSFLIWDSNGPMLVYNRIESNLSNSPYIKVSRDTIRISTEEADRLTGIITDAINKAVKPDGLGRLGFDGINFYFMLPDKMAKIWSPEKDSKCDKLVHEFERLKELFPLHL